MTTRKTDLVAALETAALVLDARAASWQLLPNGARQAVRNPVYDAHAALLRSHARLCQEYREANTDGVSTIAKYETGKALLASIRGETPTDHTQQEEV